MTLRISCSYSQAGRVRRRRESIGHTEEFIVGWVQHACGFWTAHYRQSAGAQPF